MIKGTDTTIKIVIKDQTGTPIDLSGLAGLVVIVYQKGYTIDQFSLNPQIGFRFINITDGPNGEFEIYVNASQTKNAFVGKDVFYEVKTIAVDLNFDGGDITKSSGEIKLCELKESQLKYVDLI